MPFPLNVVLDTFSGGDANPIGAPWSHDTHLENVAGAVVSGQLTGSADDFWDAIYATVFGPSVENYITIPTTAVVPTILRIKTRNITTSPIDYHVFYNPSTWSLFVDGTQLGASFTQTISNGDSIGLEYNSATGDLIAYYKAAAGSWTALATRNDTTYQTDTGKSTVESQGVAIKYDSFGGGTSTPTLVQSHYRWRNDDGNLTARIY